MNSPGSKELGNLLSILQPFHEASNSFSGNTVIFFLPSDAEHCFHKTSKSVSKVDIN